MLKYFHTICVFTLVVLASCEEKKEKSAGDVYYTCSMDPQVIESKPGNCPICKMPLTIVKKSQGKKNGVLKLSDQQIQLAGIILDTLKERPMNEEMMLYGSVAINQNTYKEISSRVTGRIEKLYFKKSNDNIEKGQPLYDIYSEEINSVVRELLITLEKKLSLKNGVEWDKIIAGSRNKLLLYGLTKQQIDQIEKDNKPLYSVTILSKYRGVIYSVEAEEGSYLNEGTAVFLVADYSTVWIQAEVDAEYMNKVREGMQAVISIPALLQKNYFGKISFLNPELNPSTKIGIARIELTNTDLQIKPGMQAYIRLTIQNRVVLSIPESAIIRNGGFASVWLSEGKNGFRNVRAETGMQANGFVEIKSGLTSRCIVVTEGAYLLNSEYIFKKGTVPMGN